jgi:Tetratricopeptide repeat
MRAQGLQPSSYSGISVEASPQIFAVMCALDAAGFDADESTLAEMPARLALRADLLKMQGPATEALRQFYRDHVFADPGETLSRYMAFALDVGPPPQFRFLVDRDLLPPDVISIEGFQQVLADFYREARLAARWGEIEPEYEPAMARYEGPLRRVVTIANAYLREVLKPSSGNAFTVYVEPLVGNHTTFRNLSDHYAIVVGTGSEIPIDDIRHAYLHFVLDPMVLRNRPVILSKATLLNIAARAPRLPVQYQTDFTALTDECLVKAVELRLRKLSPGQLEAALLDDDVSGFVLVRPLVQQLEKFEKAEPAMSYYFPDLIAGIDVGAETKRLRSVNFAGPEEAVTFKPAAVPAADPAMELQRSLDEGDRQIALQNASAAAATFEAILQKHPNQPQAMYGLAIASVLQGKAEQARGLFEKIVSPSAPVTLGSAGAADPNLVAWSHVYLGRIDDLQGERDAAVAEYRAALAVNGAPESARVAAQRGVATPYAPTAASADSETRKR